MKDRMHIAVKKEDKETLCTWAKDGDRSISAQFARLIRQERERRKHAGKEDLDS